MSASAPIDDLIGRIQLTASLFTKDVSAMSHENLSLQPGGKARSGYDLIFEVTRTNHLVKAAAQGEPISIPSRDGWLRAPDEAKNKEAALSAFQQSVIGTCEALTQVSPERFGETVQSPMGPMPLLRFAGIIPFHHMYHSGQLNYIQTLTGDDEFHW